MIIGGYELHLYCDTGNDKPDTVNSATIPHIHNYDGGFEQFVGVDKADCNRRAKRRGWRFARDGRVYCPRCSKGG